MSGGKGPRRGDVKCCRVLCHFQNGREEDKGLSRGGSGSSAVESRTGAIRISLFAHKTPHLGRVYWLKALEIPDVGVSGRGKAIVNLLELQPGETMTSARGDRPNAAHPNRSYR